MDILTINQFRVHELGQLLKGKPLLEAARQSFRLTAHVSCGNPGLIFCGAIGSRYPGNLGKAQRNTIPQASYVNTYIHIYMYTFIHIYIYIFIIIYTFIHIYMYLPFTVSHWFCFPAGLLISTSRSLGIGPWLGIWDIMVGPPMSPWLIGFNHRKTMGKP